MQGTTNMNDALRVLLQLEYFASAFYQTALGAAYSSPLSNAERQVMSQIALHQRGHITLLRGMLGSAAPAEPSTSSYDFSGGTGTWCGPFRGAVGGGATTSPAGGAVSEASPNKFDFIKLSRLIEDLSARAYIGCLPSVVATAHAQTILELVAAEGEHAAAVRGLMMGYSDNGEYTDPLLTISPTTTYWISASGSTAGAFNYSVNAYTTTRVYPDGRTQREIASGVAQVTPNEGGPSTVAIVQQGVYGPGFAVPAQGGTERSPGEDNLLQSSSLASNITHSGANVFDEPMAPDAVQKVLSLFGAA